MRATKLFLVTARTFIDYSYKNLMISVTKHIKFGKSSILQLVLRVIFMFSYPHLRFNPCSRRPLPTRGASVGIMWQAQTGVIVFSLYVCVAPNKNVRRQSQDMSSRQSNCWWGRWETMKLKYSTERIIALGSILNQNVQVKVVPEACGLHMALTVLWRLPIAQRFDYKCALLCFKCIHGVWSHYLRETLNAQLRIPLC